ncbi:ATP-binding protein [Marinilabiliaceae bacterium ANBcel2]|nr:ATP-binding protein [Marinilabiliaceae bacterium ANBcel2]
MYISLTSILFAFYSLIISVLLILIFKLRRGNYGKSLKIKALTYSLFFIIVLAGLYFIFKNQNREYEKIKDDLYSIGSNVAQGFRYSRFTSFDITKSDVNTPEFSHIASQLSTMAQGYSGVDIHTLYKENSLFYVGPHSHKESLFGIYNSADIIDIDYQCLNRLFMEGDVASTGLRSFGDKSYLTVYTPVTPPRSSTPYMAVGVSYEKDFYCEFIRRSSIPSALISGVILFILLLTIFILTSPKLDNIAPTVWYLSKDAWITFIISSVISAVIVYLSIKEERRYQEEIFKSTTMFQASDIRSNFNFLNWRINRVISDVGSLEKLDNKGFKDVISELFNYRYINVVGLAYQQDDNFYNLKYLSPYTIAPYRLNHNLPFVTEDSRTLIEKTERELMTHSEESYIGTYNQIGPCNIIYAPVTYSGDYADYMLIIIIDSNRFLKDVIESLGPDHSLFNVNFSRITSSGDKSYISSYPTELSKNSSSTSNISESYYYFYFGNTYQLQFAPSEQFLQMHSNFLFWIILPGTVVLTFLLTFVIGMFSSRKNRLQNKVEERTIELNRSEEKYRLLVENQHDYILKTDTKGRYQYVSPSLLKAFGKTEDELVGNIYIPELHPADEKITMDGLNNLLKPPYEGVIEQRVKTVNGWQWINWSYNPVFSKGELIGFIGVGRDFTKQKEYELELERSKSDLKRQNREYLMLNEEYQSLNEELRLINDELVEAIEKARESERLKTSFLQNMSHEIRTPLNAIIGFSEMVSIPEIDEQEREQYSSIIINNGRQLLDLLNNILTVSTLETRQERVKCSEINLYGLLRDLYSQFSSEVKDNLKIYAKFPVEGKEFKILSDELKLKQIFNNLISNAVKFTHVGEIVFGFEVVSDSTIRFFVKDTGIGLSDKAKEVVFERFRQAGSNVQVQYGGTGLGLAISKEHVELMGGKIWVESEENKGSVFFFELPLHKL